MTACDFLKSYLQKLQSEYDTLLKLLPCDFSRRTDPAPQTSDDEERCARLADQHDFDGNQFRGLFYSSPESDWYDDLGRSLYRRIQMLPKIIAAADKLAATDDQPADDEQPTVISMGDHQYRIGCRAPVTVSLREDGVFQAFLKQPSMDLDTMKDGSHTSKAQPVLKGLTCKYGGMFANAIRLPGGKSKGGYYVSIRREAYGDQQG